MDLFVLVQRVNELVDRGSTYANEEVPMGGSISKSIYANEEVVKEMN